MNLARLHLRALLIAGRDEAADAVDPPFAYPGPLRHLRSRARARYYLESPPEGWQETMDMSIAILDNIRHLPQSVDLRKLIGGSFMNSYVNTNCKDHLRRAITFFRGVYLSRSDQESRKSAFDDLFAALGLQYADFSQQDDLEELIHYSREVYESSSEGADKASLGQQLIDLLLEHFSASHSLESLEMALDIMPKDDTRFEPALDGYIQLRYSKYKDNGSHVELKKAFEGRRRWLALDGRNDPIRRGKHLNTLVLHLFEMNGDTLSLADLNLGVESCRDALELDGTSDDVRLQANIFHSKLLHLRYKAYHNEHDINGAVNSCEQVLAVTDPTSSKYLTRMDPLVPMHMDQVDAVTTLEARSAIQKALCWSKRIVAVCPDDHSQYWAYRCNLGNIHHWCYLYGVADADQHLQESFRVLEDAERYSQASTCYPDVLSTFSNTLVSLYETTGDQKYLDKGLSSERKVIELRKDDAIAHLHLGGSLRLKYREAQDLKILEEAVKMLLRAISLSNGSLGTKKNALRELCGAYHTMFARTHKPRDIQLAIEYGRDGLKLPSNIRDSAKLLDSLSNAYSARFEFEGEMGDLDESIRLLILAVNDHADPLVPKYLIMLADRLRLRSFNRPSHRDLNDAENHCRTALRLLPLTHAEYKHALSEVSYIRHELFKLGNEEAIGDGIKSAREALPLYQSDIENKGILLDHLGSMFYSMYERSKAEADLLKSIQYAEEALSTIPNKSLRYPTILNHTSFTLHEHMQKFGVAQHKDKIRRQLSIVVGWPTTRPLSAVRAHRILASLSMHELDWGVAFEHLSSAIQLYPKLSPRSFTADEQQRTIRELFGVAQIAASCALNAGCDPGPALEILEAGRGIISGWLINARNDVARLEGHDPDLAARYKLLREIISDDARKEETAVLATKDGASSLRNRDQLRNYLYELEAIEEKVRSEIPELKGFQRPLSVDDMSMLAKETPIVEINATALRSDAFIITSSGVTVVDLPHETTQKMEDVMNTIFGAGRHARSFPQGRGPANEALRSHLKWLYENVVSRIMADLKINPNSAVPCTQRLIWVSNGVASFCPLHAASAFSGNTNESTAAHVISSYISSLKALHFARERNLTLGLMGQKEVLVVAMPNTKGLPDISANEEAENIKVSFRRFPVNSVNVLKDPSRDGVLEGLKDSAVAHFACHGYASMTDPSQSCLLLKDTLEPGKPDRLSVGDLSAAKHNSARLCYLSACSTAENTAARLTDENMHVASAFQLSGYSHVIGTLWEADNRAAVEVARVFYNELADAVHRSGEGIIADEVVAFALHKAVRLLQEKKRPGSRLNPLMDVLAWAPFVHLGP